MAVPQRDQGLARLIAAVHVLRLRSKDAVPVRVQAVVNARTARSKRNGQHRGDLCLAGFSGNYLLRHINGAYPAHAAQSR
jgi:hypothetical protein